MRKANLSKTRQCQVKVIGDSVIQCKARVGDSGNMGGSGLKSRVGGFNVCYPGELIVDGAGDGCGCDDDDNEQVR